MKKFLSAIAALSMVCLLSAPVFAAIIIKADTNKMNLEVDWGGTAPSITNIGTFDATISAGNENPVYLGAPISLKGLVFAGTLHGNVLVEADGHTLTLDSAGIDMTAANKDVTINSAIILNAAQADDVAAGRTLTLMNIINGGNTLTVQGDGNTAINGTLGNGAGGVIKTGNGALSLNNSNTYSGTTTLNAGTLQVGADSVGRVGAITSSAVGTGVLALSGGKISSDGTTARTLYNPVTIGNSFVTLGDAVNNGKLTFSAAVNLGLLGGTAFLTTASDVEFDGAISGFNGLAKDGAGTLTLKGANTYTGETHLEVGTLQVGGDSVGGVGAITSSAVGTGLLHLSGGKISSDGTTARTLLNSVSFSGDVTFGDAVNNGKLTFSAAASLGIRDRILTTASDVEFDGAISGLGSGLTKLGAGTLTLTGNNTYTGATAINAGTVVAGNANALGNGSAVTVGAGGTLDVGTTNVTVNNNYTQNGTLKVTVASPSSSGKITSNAPAVVAATSSVNVTVASSSFIPNKTTYTIIDGAAGAGVNVPGTITSSDPRLTFSGLSLNGALILTVDRSASGFSSLSTNSNAAAVGAVLDNITNPSTDMTTVLNTLEGLSNSQTASALDTVTPTVDNGVTNVSNTSIIQFIGTSTDRLEGLYAQAHSEETGVSTGSKGRNGFEAWGRGFGEYAHQDPRGLSNGYHATIWGTAIGGDLPIFNDRARLGVSGGYAASDINSKDNSGATDINSYQSAFYGGYIDPAKPYYINGAFSFAYNTYRGKRNIDVGAIRRIANSSYRGQQYSVLLDGGYTFKTKQVNITPLASLQYIHLHIQSYTETGADALNLSVASQDYDMLQSGLGAKFDRPFEVAYGTIIPEVHAKWLYDFIADKQATTSTFSGGGGSFATNGFTPARNALDVGGRLALVTKGNWSFDANYDFEYKQDFTSHTGWADVRYSF